MDQTNEIEVQEQDANERVEQTQEKRYSESCKVSSVDAAERTVTAVISSDTIDRDREILLPKGVQLDNYEKNPVVLWGHDMSLPPIAKALWVKKGTKKITAKLKFATTERAEEIWSLFKDGFLNAFSVGFLPLKGHTPTPDEVKKNPDWAEAMYIIDEWELLEFSPVTVPSNPDALMLACKSGKLHIGREVLDALDVEEPEEEAETPPEPEKQQEESIRLNISVFKKEIRRPKQLTMLRPKKEKRPLRALAINRMSGRMFV